MNVDDLPADDVPCRHLVELLTEYLEGAMPPEISARVAEHIAACTKCATYVEQFQQTIALLGGLAEHDVTSLPPDVRAELVAAFRAPST